MSKILIVDDEKDMSWSISKILELKGHTSVAVDRGEKAIEKVRSEDFDLIILDMQLPGMDGVHALKEIRKITRTLPVIFVTGYGSTETAAQVIKLGANDYLSKPFHNRDLIKIVDRQLHPTPPQTEESEIPQFRQSLARKLGLKSTEHITAAESLSDSSPRQIVLKLHTLLGIIFFIFLIIGSFHYKESLLDYFQKGKVWQYPLPYSHPSTLTWDGEQFWSIDWFDKAIYTHKFSDNHLTTSKMIGFKESRPTGIVKTAMGFYICDPWKKEIKLIEIGPDAQPKLLASYHSPGPNPSGLCSDGSFLWSCDLETKKIYKHAFDARLSVVDEFPSGVEIPVGLAVYGENLWVLDNEKSLLIRYNISQGLKMTETFSIAAKVFGKTVGLAVRKNEFFILTENPVQLYRIKYIF